MERGLLLLVATLVVFGAGEVEGTNHLSFSNMTVNISRDGCGVSKVCVAEPENCDPAENNMCILATFESASRPPNVTLLRTELSGYSMDFIALGLTRNSSMNTTFFFCYVRNDTLRFRTMERNSSGSLSPSEPRVEGIRGNRTGMRVECEFDILKSNISNYSIVIVNGTFTNGTPTIETELLRAGPLDFSNLTMVNATPPTNTTSAAGHLHATALLVLLSILSLFALLAA